AYAAQAFGIPCVVVIRDDAQVTKLQAIRRYGAEIVLTPIGRWQERLEEEQHERDLHLVHPFDDPAVAAGQGTVGLEILEAVPDVRTVIVPVGGGGLIAGVAVAIKQQRSNVRIIGVEPERAPTVSESLAAGHPVSPSRLDTIADGLAAPYTRPFNLALIQRLVDEVRTVSDEAIIAALTSIVLQAKLVVEPAGAAGVAALPDDAVQQLCEQLQPRVVLFDMGIWEADTAQVFGILNGAVGFERPVIIALGSLPHQVRRAKRFGADSIWVRGVDDAATLPG